MCGPSRPTPRAAPRTKITDDGRAEVRQWFQTPVARSSRPRDELAIKLAMAVAVEGVDVAAVVQAQRRESMRVLRDYTRLRAANTEETELAWLLVLDSLIFATEAEVRWLDHVEAVLVRSRPGPVPAGQPEPDTAEVRP